MQGCAKVRAVAVRGKDDKQGKNNPILVLYSAAPLPPGAYQSLEINQCLKFRNKDPLYE